MFKELASKAFKFIAASVGLLIAAYTVGWSGAITLHALFKTERIEAQEFVATKLNETEKKLMQIREADMNGINGQLKILIDQNNLIISQNYRTRKIVLEKVKL